jgi:hypothetical protein
MAVLTINNSISTLGNRTIRRADSKRKKEKRKMIATLLSKHKIDFRSGKNLEDFFNYISNKFEFTIPQVTKNTGMSSVAWTLADSMLEKHLIVKTGEKTSSGRGKTDVFALTPAGKIMAAYVTESNDQLSKAICALKEKETNPILRFSLDAFLQNYQDPTMRSVLEDSFETAVCKTNTGEISETFTDIMLEALSVAPTTQDSTARQIAIKNIQLVESQHNVPMITYMKMQLESSFLTKLNGKKLDKYIEALQHDAFGIIHLPCENPDCNEVIRLSRLMDLTFVDSPLFCVKCTPMGTKEGK